MSRTTALSEPSQGEHRTITGEKDGEDIVTVRIDEAKVLKQALPVFEGISGETAGAKGLTLYRVVIPPGVEAEAHYHDGYETAIYLLQGTVETRYGDGLKKSVVNKAGEFVFIPPNVPHQPKNVGTETAIGIVARNDPNEQESVVLYDAVE